MAAAFASFFLSSLRFPSTCAKFYARERARAGSSNHIRWNGFAFFHHSLTWNIHFLFRYLFWRHSMWSTTLRQTHSVDVAIMFALLCEPIAMTMAPLIYRRAFCRWNRVTAVLRQNDADIDENNVFVVGFDTRKFQQFHRQQTHRQPWKIDYTWRSRSLNLCTHISVM